MGKGVCSICREVGLVQQDIYKCKMGSCGHYMHHKCLKAIEAAGQYLKIFKYAPPPMQSYVAKAGRSFRNSPHPKTCDSHCQECEENVQPTRLKVPAWTCKGLNSC